MTFSDQLIFLILSICKHGEHYFKVMSAGKIVNASKAYLLPRWSTFLKYGKSELTPPSPGEIPQAIAQAVRLVTSATTFQFRHTTVRVRFKLWKISIFKEKREKLYN